MMTNTHKKIAAVVLVLAGLWLVSSIFKTAPVQTSAPRSGAATPEEAAAERQAMREMLPPNTNVPDGDEPALKKMYKEKFGLEIREFRKNPDGTFDAVIAGGREVHLKQAPVFTGAEQKEYTKEFMNTFNEGKKVEITEQDKKEIGNFRRGVLGQ